MHSSLTRPRVAAACVAALVLLGAPTAFTGSLHRAPPKTVQVTITYDADSGTLAVDPDPVTVHRGERLEWVSDAGTWKVVVPSEDMPFGQAAKGKGVGAARGKHAGADVAANAKYGTYKYIVSVFDGTEVHILDPEVVVGRGG